MRNAKAPAPPSPADAALEALAAALAPRVAELVLERLRAERTEDAGVDALLAELGWERRGG